MKQCFKCSQLINESHFLLADCQYWHEDCLRCICCDAKLAELDKTFYIKNKMILCKRDYLRIYGPVGECAVCSEHISAYEMVMKIPNQIYHLSCFSCQYCLMRFCVGDRFYMHNNMILCEYHYYELLNQAISNVYAQTATLSTNNNFKFKSLNSISKSNSNNCIATNNEVCINPECQTNFHCQTSSNFEYFPFNTTLKFKKIKVLSNKKLICNSLNFKLIDQNVLDDKSSGYGSPSSSTS